MSLAISSHEGGSMTIVEPKMILQQTKKRSLRLKGVFCLLAGLVFMAEVAFSWNNNVTVLILLLLDFIYVFLFQQKETGKESFPLARKVFRFLGKFVLYLIGFAFVLGVWVFLWR